MKLFYAVKRQFGNSGVSYLLCAVLFLFGFIVCLVLNTEQCKEISRLELDDKIERKKHASFLIVLIFSAPGNNERRQAIRTTWLLKKGNNILHFFAIGAASLSSQNFLDLKSEHGEHKDLILLSSVTDSYSKLSEKLKETLLWLDENVSYTFLLKVDDDSFVRLDAFYNTIMKLPQKRLYWGFFDGQASVKKKGKWAEKNWFLCDRYLPYAKGGGYVLSSDLVHLLVLTSDYLSLYQNEDVSLGTWLAPFEIKRLHEPNFDTEYRSRGCFNSYLIMHKQSVAMMNRKFENIKKTGNLCLSEYRIRNSYLYNWNAPPSECCIRNNSKVP